MRTPLVLAALALLATPLALAGPLPGPIAIPHPSPYGDHYVGPCDYWTNQFDVGDSSRLTCDVEGHSIYFHQGQAGLVWECGYWVDGHDLYSCGPLVN